MNTLIEKQANLNTYFFTEDIQMTNRYMKIFSTSLSIREQNANQSFNEISLHRGAIITNDISQNAIITKSTNNEYWRGCGEKEPSFIVGGNVNWCCHCGKQYDGSSKN